MSQKELREFCVEKGFSFIKVQDEFRKNFDEIKVEFEISSAVRFRTCNSFSKSSIAWINANENKFGKLLMFRISNHTLKKIVICRNKELQFDLLSIKFKQSNKTSQNVLYDEYHITAHNEFDPYDDEQDLDPDGRLQNDARREMFEGFSDNGWGGLSGEEAELGYWNCD
jgi:hypothetical protein